ncbi:MAG: hypothetical protein IPN17_05590 [Deltaproteobacteria bacterium]|jgi:hypothetical protein|nr:hypothetical protein [Deltaproteobacteria bacterium]MBK8691777.1 hypothetical protein [Deltaproteobacteria bacterium]MBP6834692.1 hypothetical protein [Deltaproteobacteria bacterium]
MHPRIAVLLVAVALPTLPAVAQVSPTAPPRRTVAIQCERACHRIEACLGRPDRDCRSACVEGMGVWQHAASYASCSERLTCVQIQRSMSMNSGPLGECFTRAARLR